MNLDRIDRIEISSEAELKRLYDWRDRNKDLVRKFNPVLQEGLIVYGPVYRQYFRVDGDRVYITVYFFLQNGQFKEVLSYNFINLSMARCQTFDEKYDSTAFDMPKEEAINDSLSTYCALMAYMEHYQEIREIVQRTTTTIIHQKKAKHGKKQKRTVRAAKVVYKVTVPNRLPKIRKPIERQAEAWGVRGHWRQYKSGKRVWIKHFEKGEGRKQVKTYEV